LRQKLWHKGESGHVKQFAKFVSIGNNDVVLLNQGNNSTAMNQGCLPHGRPGCFQPVKTPGMGCRSGLEEIIYK
jgi:phosphoribosyl-AMP cyclohydrolase